MSSALDERCTDLCHLFTFYMKPSNKNSFWTESPCKNSSFRYVSLKSRYQTDFATTPFLFPHPPTDVLFELSNSLQDNGFGSTSYNIISMVILEWSPKTRSEFNKFLYNCFDVIKLVISFILGTNQ